MIFGFLSLSHSLVVHFRWDDNVGLHISLCVAWLLVLVCWLLVLSSQRTAMLQSSQHRCSYTVYTTNNSRHNENGRHCQTTRRILSARKMKCDRRRIRACCTECCRTHYYWWAVGRCTTGTSKLNTIPCIPCFWCMCECVSQRLRERFSWHFESTHWLGHVQVECVCVYVCVRAVRVYNLYNKSTNTIFRLGAPSKCFYHIICVFNAIWTVLILV